MGYELIIRPHKYWPKWENAKKELEEAIKENNGEFPSQRRLDEMGRSSLARAIAEYHGKFSEVRERMGYEGGRKVDGYWKEWDNVEDELRKAIKENNGEFPSQRRLNEMIRSSLARAIAEYHGGFPAVRGRIGYELIKKPHKYWKKWENVEKELKKAIKENNGEFPSQKKLEEMRRGGLAHAITTYHGKFSEVRGRMGYGKRKKVDGYWKKWENVEKELKKAIEENNGEFPSQRRLDEMGRGGLASAIIRYHDGFPVVRKKIGYELKEKPRMYWPKWENVNRELEEAIKENNGEFPSQTRLYGMGRSSLARAITKYHGGFPVVREHIGYNEQMRIKLARELEDIVRALY